MNTLQGPCSIFEHDDNLEYKEIAIDFHDQGYEEGR